MPENKSLSGRILLVLKGVAMGAADVVPGVSGGTIAFITGIYEELLETLSKLNFGLFKIWKNEGFGAMWKQANGSFLLTLFAGIAISIFSLAVLVEYLLTTFPILLWAFFFGLVMASVWLVGKQVSKWNWRAVLAIVFGTVVAYHITVLSPTGGVDALWYVFLCGSIAICAMILPGISGSFILLLLGAYTSILGAASGLVKGLSASDWAAVTANGSKLLIFIAGCVVGLVLFSRFLNMLFKRSFDVTVAVLTGFLIGSLNKIWPWKEVLETFVKHKGEPNEETVPLVAKNVLPETWAALPENIAAGIPHQMGMAIVWCLVGLAIILILDRFAPKTAKR